MCSRMISLVIDGVEYGLHAGIDSAKMKIQDDVMYSSLIGTNITRPRRYNLL